MATRAGPYIINSELSMYIDKQNINSYSGEPTINLIDNGGFEVNNSGWTNNQTATWERVYHNGRWCLKCTMNQNNSTPGIKQNTWSFAVSPNTTYRFTALVDKGTIGTGVQMYIRAANDSYVLLNAGTSASNGTWTENSYTFTTSSNHTALNYVLFYANMEGQLSGQYFFIDDVQIEQKSHATKFVDGTRSTTDGWKDLSGNNNPVDFDAVTFTSTNIPGTIRNDFSFDGTDDFGDIDYITSGVETITAWIKNTGGGHNGIVFCPWTNGHDNWFGIDSYKINILATQSADVNNFWVNGITTMTQDVWYYIAVTIDYTNQTVKCYLNGVLENSVTRTHSIGNWSGHAATIGRRGSIAQRYFNGEISKVSIYNKVLTEEELFQNYKAHKYLYV